MGLKSVKCFADVFLGRNTKFVWATNFGSSCPQKNPLTTLVMSSILISEQLSKKWHVKP